MSLENFRNFTLFSELIAAILGTIFFYKYKNTPLRYFLFMLWYINITEFTSWYSAKNNVLLFYDEKGSKYSLWMYNLLYTIFYPVVLLIYYRMIDNLKFKNWILSFTIIYLIISIINWSFVQSFIYEWSETPDITGSAFLGVAIIFYFIELLKSNSIIIYHKKLLFWISVGLLIHHIVTIPFQLKVTEYAMKNYIHSLFLIIWISSFIMYLLFIFGFIWSNKEEDVT